MMFDDYDDYDDDVDDEYLYAAGSDDDDYYMNRDGEIIYAGDGFDGDYLEHLQVLVKPSLAYNLMKKETSKKDDAEVNAYELI